MPAADDAANYLDAAIAALDGQVFLACHGLWRHGTPVKGSATVIQATCPECGTVVQQRTDWPPSAA